VIVHNLSLIERGPKCPTLEQNEKARGVDAPAELAHWGLRLICPHGAVSPLYVRVAPILMAPLVRNAQRLFEKCRYAKSKARHSGTAGPESAANTPHALHMNARTKSYNGILAVRTSDHVAGPAAFVSKRARFQRLAPSRLQGAEVNPVGGAYPVHLCGTPNW